jgi:predicted acyl esterase
VRRTANSTRSARCPTGPCTPTGGPCLSCQPTLLEVEIWPTSITLDPGDRLRLELASDDDDLAPLTHDHHPRSAAIVHTGGDHASHLLLPVIPGVEG